MPLEMDGDGEFHRLLRSHLEATYRTPVVNLTRLPTWPHSNVHRVDRADGSSWVARAFAAERPQVRVEGDAAILRHLEELGYPAERLAHAVPVSRMDDRPVLVTEYIHGTQPDDSARTLGLLAKMLARLATLPCDDGAPSRDAGAWGADPNYEGRPRQDIVGALAILDEIDGRVPRQYLSRYESLRHQLDGLGDLEGLPEGLVHPDAIPVNAVQSRNGSTVFIDWTSAGRGPRLSAFGWLLSGWYGGGPIDRDKTDALAEGYAAHVRLEDEELDRIPDAMRIRGLVCACWGLRWAVVRDEPPAPAALHACDDEDNAVALAIAARVREVMKTRGSP